MKLDNQLELLTWNNYSQLIDYLDANNFKQEFWSPVALVSWMCYGIKFCFRYLDNNQGVLMYIYKQYEAHSTWRLTSCFYCENCNYKQMLETAKQDLKSLNGNDNLRFNLISEAMITDWHLNPQDFHQSTFVSNYIYYLDSFKTFAGKKMQKKRNHLNFFVANYQNISIKKINEVADEALLEFCHKHILEYQGQANDSEYQTYVEFIKCQRHQSNRYKGIVVFIDGKIQGLTLCYLRKNICEIIIEKANREYRGIYQYLISQNLLINNIDQEYMDRQDDANNEKLAKSKRDYQPIFMIRRYSSK